MSADYEFTFHHFDEREFRERFLPAVQGDEPIVRELLDAADASGPSWTALHKLFDETRVLFQQAVESEDGDAVLRTIFAAFGRFVSHLRPVYSVRGFAMSLIDRQEFPELTSRIKSAGIALLRDANGNTLAAIPEVLPPRVPRTCRPGRSGGGVILKSDVRPFLDQFRKDLPRLIDFFRAQGIDPEPGITMLLSALVQAKLKGWAMFEASDVLLGDQHLPKTHKLVFEKPDKLPPAVLREVAKLFGREIEQPKAPKPAPAPPPPEVVSYTPQGTYKVGQRLEHKSFGTGEVTRIVDSRRLEVRFAEEEKTLIQGLKVRSADPEPAGDDDSGNGTEG